MKPPLAIVLLLLAMSGAATAGDETLREYTWLTVGEPSGSMALRQAADGSTHLSFKFNDRGRGPETETVLRRNDPTRDIEALYRVNQVVKGRQLFNAPEILKAQGFIAFTQ